MSNYERRLARKPGLPRYSDGFGLAAAFLADAFSRNDFAQPSRSIWRARDTASAWDGTSFVTTEPEPT